MTTCPGSYIALKSHLGLEYRQGGLTQSPWVLIILAAASLSNRIKPVWFYSQPSPAPPSKVFTLALDTPGVWVSNVPCPMTMTLPTEPACWLGEVCEVLLHCLLPVHYTVNLDHNTGSIFFNTDFILRRAETLKPVTKNCDEMPPVNLEVLELISSFSMSGRNQPSFQWTTFLAQFSFYFSS